MSNSLLSVPFILSYAREGFVLASRTHQGQTEVAGGPLDFVSGNHTFRQLTYATHAANTREVAAQLKQLNKPAQCVALGPVELTDGNEALVFLEALAGAYHQGAVDVLLPQWRGAAQLLFAAVPPMAINVVRVFRPDTPQQPPSQYDW